MKRLVLLLTGLALATACGGRRPAYDGMLVTLGPVAAGGKLFYATSDARLVRVDPAGTAPVWAPLAAAPSQLIAAGDGVVVLAPAAHALHRASASGKLDAPAFDLPSPYDAVAVSGDARFALCTYGPAQKKVGARNLNEVGLVDLDAGTVRKVLLDTASLAPQAVLFSPPDASPRFAAVLLTSGVALLDLESPARKLRVDLRLAGAALSPRAAVFGPDARHLFVAANGADDVFAIALGDDGAGNLQGRINFLPGGKGPQSLLALAEQPNGVVAVYASGDAALLDADGRSEREVRVVLPTPAADAAVLPGLASGALPTLLLSGGASDAVYLWDLAAKVVEPVKLGARYRTEAVMDGGFALFTHASLPFPGGDTPGLTDLEVSRDGAGKLKARPRPVQLETQLAGAAFDAATGSWLFTLRGQKELWRLPVATALPESVALDSTALSVGVAGGFAFIESDAPYGDLTFVPQDRFERAAAKRQTGFFLTGAAERADQGPTP